MRTRSMLAAVALVALAACQGGGGGSASTATTTASATTAPAPVTATPPGTCPGFHGVLTELRSVGPSTAAALIGADAGAVGCLDQVTFTFRTLGDGKAPGYDVHYQDPGQSPFLDGDPPTPIALPGTAFLLVTMSPAASVDPNAPGAPSTYDGNLSLEYGDHSHFQIVRKLPDGLGTVVWVIGLDSVQPFRVDRAENPPRVTIYIG